MKKLLVLFAVLALGVGAHAATVTWDVAGGGNWSSSGNWDGSAVPSNGDDVIVPSAASSRTTTVDVQGVTYHATVGANLPATGSYTSPEQMYWIICDDPMFNWSYQNYTTWSASSGSYGLLNWTADTRWRNNPALYRYVDVSEGEFSDFLGKYHCTSGFNAIDNDKNKKEDAVPTPQLTFDVANINNAGAPKLYIAHDNLNAGERPTWMSGYTDTGKDLYSPDRVAPTWDVYETTLSSSTAGTGDSTGWISDGGFLASLDISQSTAGVTHTLALAHDLAVSTVPTFNVTAGSVVIDIGNYWFQVAVHGTVIPNNVTVLLNGGVFGKRVGDTIGGSPAITIEAGGTVSGTGSLNPGAGDCVIEEGGTLDVGAGTLALNFPYGQTFRWRGAITGNGTSSILSLAAGLSNGQLKGIEDMAGNVNASIDGIVTLRLFQNYADMTFGRFADPSKINLSPTTLALYNSQQFLWEAQTLMADVVDDPANIDFKLGGYTPFNNCTLKLVDTAAVPDDFFVYIGQLSGLTSSRKIDLNDIALLTDMDQASLQAFVTAGAIVNTGTAGAPTVKTVTMYSNPGVMWYVAPATVEIATPPPPGSAVIVR